MARMTRRGFLATAAAASTVRAVPGLTLRTGGGRHVLRLVYDKGLRMMRAIDTFVP
ncbi:Tat pathway signal protein [uncultured Tateyamaria sp.]|uniref:Tat pathway signal protein n=1 Tax=uncultured Tateyamaria sp. TaxID=455651 RepID=UPI002602AED0|nr:Tat pathway signal protein [uncultured Tateyamaria sp.]